MCTILLFLLAYMMSVKTMVMAAIIQLKISTIHLKGMMLNFLGLFFYPFLNSFIDSDILYVISSYGRSVYKHPHIETIELISNQGSRLVLVDQPPTTSSCILKYSI